MRLEIRSEGVRIHIQLTTFPMFPPIKGHDPLVFWSLLDVLMTDCTKYIATGICNNKVMNVVHTSLPPSKGYLLRSWVSSLGGRRVYSNELRIPRQNPAAPIRLSVSCAWTYCIKYGIYGPALCSDEYNVAIQRLRVHLTLKFWLKGKKEEKKQSKHLF